MFSVLRAVAIPVLLGMTFVLSASQSAAADPGGSLYEQRKEAGQLSINIAGNVTHQLTLDATPITAGMTHSGGSH